MWSKAAWGTLALDNEGYGMMSLPRIAFLDCETLGLDKTRHAVWEWGIITGDPYDDDSGYSWNEYVWHLEPDMSIADPGALRVNRLYERMAAKEVPVCWGGMTEERPLWDDSRVAARSIATLLAGRTVIGAVVNFDTERLEDWLRVNGQCGAWHYHIVDVETLVAGYVMGLAGLGAVISFCGDLTPAEVVDIATPDWKSSELLAAVGVPPVPEKDRHTALGDCRWARAAYCLVYGYQV